jgi:hypothetical protein
MQPIKKKIRSSDTQVQTSGHLLLLERKENIHLMTFHDPNKGLDAPDFGSPMKLWTTVL